MSNDLVISSSMSYDELAKITGQDTGSSGPLFPRLSVNRDAEDDDGNPLPVGTYTYKDTTGQHFSKTAKFRPFMNVYQYSVYDSDTKKYTNRTIMFKNFRDELIDIKGGTACGKVMGKEKDNLSEAQKEQQKKIKCARIVFGQVTFPDKEPVAVLWKMGGSNFMAPDAVFKELAKNKRLFWTTELDLSLTRKKAGATTYYEMGVEYDRTVNLPFTEDDFALLRQFNEIVTTENDAVRALYQAALKDTPTQDDINDERSLADILGNDDLDD